MRRQSRARSAIALILGIAMTIEVPGVGILVAAQAPAASPAKPAPAQTQPAKATTQPKAAAKPAAASAPNAGAAPAVDADGGWPRAYSTPSGGQLLLYQPQVASWDGQKHMVAYAAVSYQPKGAQKPALGTIKIESDTTVSVAERLVNFTTVPDHRSRTSTRSTDDQTREVVADDHRRHPRQGARDRARPRAGLSRQEPDHPEERRRREGRSAADLLQHEAGGPGEPRRRSDLEPDQGQRPQVRRQHELGSLPARADQDVLPAQRAVVAHGDRRQRAVDARGHSCPRASRSCPPTTTGRTSRRRCRARSSTPTNAEGVRQHEAGRD